MVIPSVLIAGHSCSDLTEVIKSITGADSLPVAVEIEENILSYPWHIDTKYYTTDVNLCITNIQALSNETYANTVEAIIIYFDSSVKDGLKSADNWLTFLKEYDPAVKILLCERCDSETSTGVSKLNAQEWCLGKGFELVELSPEVEEDNNEDCDFMETTGIPRIVQALHAHVWPNLVMKSESENSFVEGNSELEFSELFSELINMKDRVSHLPPEQRKACAEKVVLAFWKAIGGDESEINCEDDDDED